MKLLPAGAALLCCLVVATAAFAGEECWYFPKRGDDEVRDADCLRAAPSTDRSKLQADATVSKRVARALAFDADGLAFVRGATGFSYVNRSRMARATVNFDNGPDYFSEGLARTRRNGKIGYFDKSLKIVIEPQFDFAFPFEGGLAIVCNGCVGKRVGEHEIMSGGLWGAVDRNGKIVHPIQFDADELRKRLAE